MKRVNNLIRHGGWGQTFDFINIGTAKVIKGWDDGIIVDLCVGAKAHLVILRELEYGDNSAGFPHFYFLVESCVRSWIVSNN